MEDDKIVGGIPFADDLLFHFWNKNTVITDTYIYDAISGLKLYPKKSKAVKATALSTGIKLPNSEIDLIGKVEVFLHHKLADVENFGFIWAGQNTSSPYGTTGLYLTSGKVGYSTMFKGSAAANCIILSSALQDDNYYIITSDFNTSNVTMKANKVTIVNNAVVIGNNINGSTTAKGTEALTADIGILSGRDNSSYVYSSKHKVIWVKFYDKSGALMHEFNFSEGAGEQTFDVVTGNAYPISNINLDPAAFWNYTQDFNHYNFKYGFTLYQKSGSADIRIPNKKDGTEIVPSAVPSGYSRIANYKECKKSFNQCENLFKLDDVSAGVSSLTGTFPQGWWAGTMPENVDFSQTGISNGKPIYTSSDGDLVQWEEDYSGFKWTIRSHLYLPGVQCYSEDDVATPDLCTTWIGRGNYVEFVLVSGEPSDLYSADPDHVLFTEGTGVAKEIDIQGVYSDVVDDTLDRGHLYIDEDSDKNMMLYGTDKGVGTPEDLKVWKYVNK